MTSKCAPCTIKKLDCIPSVRGACEQCRVKKSRCNLQPWNDSGRPDRRLKTKEEVQRIRLEQVETERQISVNPSASRAESREGVEGPVQTPSPSTALAGLCNLALNSQPGPSQGTDLHRRAVSSGGANSPNSRPRTPTPVSPPVQDSSPYMPATPTSADYAGFKSKQNSPISFEYPPLDLPAIPPGVSASVRFTRSNSALFNAQSSTLGVDAGTRDTRPASASSNAQSSTLRVDAGTRDNRSASASFNAPGSTLGVDAGARDAHSASAIGVDAPPAPPVLVASHPSSSRGNMPQQSNDELAARVVMLEGEVEGLREEVAELTAWVQHCMLTLKRANISFIP